MTPEDFLAGLPAERQAPMGALRDTLRANLPAGFAEVCHGGMLSWVVPHALYPGGYHCDPKQALPFVSIASQKNFVAMYHMGLYSDPELLAWFTAAYPSHSKTKLDMGKSCVRFKKPEAMPLALIGELAAKMTPGQWIERYETALRRA